MGRYAFKLNFSANQPSNQVIRTKIGAPTYFPHLN